MRGAALAAALLFAFVAPASRAQQAPVPIIDRCAAQTCIARLTPQQLLVEAEKLVVAKRYDEARPMLAALVQVPELSVPTRFLSGMAAAGAGDHAAAAALYKAILADHPGETRVRLELAREMLAMGKAASADRQFKLAQQDRDLPDDVARTIRAVRDVIRARRAWRLNVDLGLAPDTNINNATAADSVSILLGDESLPLTLDESAKPRSGTGQTGSISAGLRLPMGRNLALLTDVDTFGTNYAGATYDDYYLQAAAGPELRIDSDTSVSLQAVGARRWYGGIAASTQFGAKAGFQLRLDDRSQFGLQVDARRTTAHFDSDYDGWQTGAYATYERALGRTLVVSGGAFARRDWLRVQAYSSRELGAIAGIGGELPLGINFGVSGTVSRARYDAPVWLFALEPRSDWRYSARATLGNRKIALWGFSPQVSATWSRSDSSIDYYANERLRMRFALARYF